jgi:hypothetical protein
MAMKELLRVTLDAAKIREACEAFVATRIQPDEEAHAEIRDGVAFVNDLIVEVIVRKRRVRKAKGEYRPPVIDFTEGLPDYGPAGPPVQDDTK